MFGLEIIQFSYANKSNERRVHEIYTMLYLLKLKIIISFMDF
jgi:hypothetical protein